MEDEMDHTAIKTRVDALSKAMLAKGLRQPGVHFEIRSDEQFFCYPTWENKKIGNRDYKFIHADDPERALDEADAFVAALPDLEQARFQEFMTALGAVIDLGRENGIETDFVNPLVETMKRLSENAITDQRVAA
jgi:hypothetical protein